MSKAVKWQIPFVSTIEKTKYRIDIYAEGYTGNPIQLLGGPQPFVTEENKSDDFFTPVRSQTGNIQVCTAIPAGGTLSLDDILPANNIDHPVRLVSISGNTETIEWQGFLSCEAYSQQYTSIPQILTISVISVLEAMDSVQMNQGTTSGLQSIHVMLWQVFMTFDGAVGMETLTDIYYSAESYRILEQQAEMNALFKEDKIQLTNSVQYVVRGITCKECLERLCKFMGWICRESATSILFQRIGEAIGMYKDSITNFREDFHTNAILISNTASNIADLEWRGTEHKRDLRQGARRVELTAKLDSDDIKIKMPEPPMNDTVGGSRRCYIKDGNQLKTLWIDIDAEKNDAYYNNVQYNYYQGQSGTAQSGVIITENVVSASRADYLQHSYLFYLSQGINKSTLYAGAALCRYFISNDEYERFPEIKNGLYCSLFQNVQNASLNPIFSIKTMKKYCISLRSGSTNIKVKGECYFFGYDTANNRAIITNEINDSFLNIINANIKLGLRVGNFTTDGVTWYDRVETMDVQFKNGGFEISIPVNVELEGDIELSIYADSKQQSSFVRDANILYELLINSLSVTQEFPDSLAWNPTSENNYVQLLNTNFRDEIKIETDWATSLNNKPSQSILYQKDSIFDLLKTISYSLEGGGTEDRRPELDLLNRLASYYGAARQTLDLITKHPTAAVLPLLKLSGIGDNKTHLPLSESRDWREETCTLKCFETI